MVKKGGTNNNSESETTVLVLQGGGALGAYQAGVYEELAENGYHPGWVSGISIGAINAALVAGNEPGKRVERLRGFWETISSVLPGAPLISGEDARFWFNEASANYVAMFGLPGFFHPRIPPAMFSPPGTPAALSFYDTAELRATLLDLIDFDLINAKKMRLSVGAVNVRTGNFDYFDNNSQTIGPEHIMASGALPPGFPPIQIDGEYYWDGGLVSNTPLQYVLDEVPRPDMLVFQVDLFSARGPLPRTVLEGSEREKDIRFSSRTRLNTDAVRQNQSLRRAAHRLFSKLPDSLKNDPDAQFLSEAACNAAITIVHLIHRRKNFYSQSKDYEFSRLSVNEHWESGRLDVRKTIAHGDWNRREKPSEGVTVFDLTQD